MTIIDPNTAFEILKFIAVGYANFLVFSAVDAALSRRMTVLLSQTLIAGAYISVGSFLFYWTGRFCEWLNPIVLGWL